MSAVTPAEMLAQIIERKKQGRIDLAALSFEEKIQRVENLKDALVPLREAKEARARDRVI